MQNPNDSLASLFPQSLGADTLIDANSSTTVVVPQDTSVTSVVAVSDQHPVSSQELHPQKVKIIIRALKSIEQQVTTVLRMLEEHSDALAPADLTAAIDTMTGDIFVRNNVEEGRVVEGVFDGQQMVGGDGKPYTVPPNYASKSKLVEGDLLKLTVTPKGSFIYKQVGPIERSRIVGSLGFDPTTEEYYVTSETKRWSVIKASVTYFKGDAGDEAVILVPKNAPSKWAAVENILKKGFV